MEVYWCKWCCCVPLIKLHVALDRVYEPLVDYALASLDMDSNVKCKTIYMPSKRVRGWFVFFGMFMLAFAVVLAGWPAYVLGLSGWVMNDAVLPRTLAGFIFINGATFILFAHDRVESFHSIMAVAAAAVCAVASLTLVAIAIEVDSQIQPHTLTLVVLLFCMSFVWTYNGGHIMKGPRDDIF